MLSSTGRAQEAWLVTYGPGEEVWEMFGHNALWLRDPATGLDHTYSFGYFEIERAGFHLDFARGIMNYYGAASPAEREFAFYRQRGRSISAQKLALAPEQVRELHRALHGAIHPHPRFYAYDYYRANCSTWLRDLINDATGDQLRPGLQATPARLNYRDHTRRMTHHRPWIQTGILLLMGHAIDQPITAWEEAFLPEALARWLAEAELDTGPLVTDRMVLHDPGIFVPPPSPRSPWGLLLLAGLVGGGLIVLATRRGGAAGAWVWRLGAAGAGLAGSVLLLMALATDHHDTGGNAALLLLHPLWWLLLVPRVARWKRWLKLGLLLSMLAGALVLAWPGLLQDRPALLGLLLPILAAILWSAGRSRR
ncbi:DUF4105 domain-containing protein [Wenzhouxiangella limi]|uniref:DUF4105 domain-containing protein n=1 Tax=Wenzhouxiangella limi TaxID=2707351 RepID=A0A845URW6_9GAMM|nr:DUF4105 domain-containing protein [Wenzhouxiangella limi]NDY94583.1 DUF4105 domain-containing protein [Wenzhouxiangella limi]